MPGERRSKPKIRAKHEGTVWEKDGRWYGQIMLDGTRYLRSGPTRREVGKKLAELRARHDRAQLTKGGGVRLGDYLQRWLTGIRGTVSDKHWDSHARNIRLHLAPLLDTRLDRLTPAELRTLYGQLQTPPQPGDGRTKALGPRMVKAVHSTLHQALDQAVQDGLVPRDVTTAVRTPKLKPQTRGVLSKVEQAQLLTDAERRGDRLVALWRMVLRVGARSSEILGLTWEDLDWERGTVTINKQIDRIEQGRPIWKPAAKSTAGLRLLYLPPSVLRSLREHRQRQEDEKTRAGLLYQDFGLIFCTKKGTALDKTNTGHYWKRACERAGVPVVVFHAARHTAASSYIAAGVPIPEVAQILGHASPAVTTQIYSHLIERASGQAARDIDQFLDGEAQSGAKNG